MRVSGLLLFFFLLSTTQYTFAAGPRTYLSREQTLERIKKITTSPYRCYYEWYGNYGLTSKEVCTTDDDLDYIEHYRDNGKIESKGLLDGHTAAGTWWYYDAQGKLFKEYNFGTRTKKLFGIKEEKFQWAFDSILRTAERTLNAKMGKHYVLRHVDISPFIQWYSRDEDEDNDNGHYPYMPGMRPYIYYAWADVYYDDSILVESISLTFDSTFTLTKINDDDPTKFHRGTFTVGFDQAALIAANRDYKQPTLMWSKNFREYYWFSTKCEATDDPYDDEDCTYLIYSAKDGKPIPWYHVEYRTCRPSTKFTTFCTDTVVAPAAKKKVGFSGAAFIVPMDWFVTNVDRSGTDINFLTNGKDTLFGYSTCGLILKNYLVATPFDTVSMNRFAQRFPGNTIQGRSYRFVVLTNADGTFDIDFLVNEDINAMSCGNIAYQYNANHVTAERRDAIMEMLMSIHFARCIPVEPAK